MSGCHETVVHFHPGGQLVALVGNPNCGKTALFNLLTGSRQKVANYAGVTVERKEGVLRTAAGKTLRVLDLPGAYSLHPRSPDERVTVDVLYGRAEGERRPDVVVCVVDATNLRRNLRLVLAVQRLGLPCVVALNMADMAARRGIAVDAEALSRELGVPVVPTVGIKADGDRALRALLEDKSLWRAPQKAHETLHHDGDHHAVQRILERLDLDKAMPETASDRIDRVVLHPVAGPAILALLLFLVFQAVFAWAEAPMGWIEDATTAAGEAVGSFIPEGVLHSFVVDGLIAGLGGVVVFLPQILILFFFILLLEESGYLPRAAFLLDRLMGGVGLSGRSFIPLLSSFACAIPGIMATRTIADPRDRIVTILLAPMMTCSARLPVYALLIAAFIPARQVAGGLELQGLVLFALYMAGIAGAFAIAWVLKRFGSGKSQVRTLMMELPAYHWPTVRSVALGLWQRATIFLRRVGGVILVLTVVLWALSSFPAPPEGATGPAIEYSLAGRIGQALAVVFAPVGFNWQISIALVPAMGAREVAVAALATVYAVGDAGDEAGSALAPLLAQDWSMATALALMAWFVFAPQCLSTLATIKRETGGWKWALITAGYLFVLAYVAALITYRVALAFGL
ncbi:ferrous iron transporter B [Rubrivivax gelatinosus]|uniref:Fe(2+) transporter FeoB n=1 Tax=Rubrivivax gelatinosus TaxID=28068 RepID=A0A4R2MDN0_RUBGE|nr:ferrous iron transporter B [Rubrivivax gelatinosus]MBK1687179.1 ferrous iron transporter B [Rubrivivax gelatinosus]TCP02584.1 ferrous iron transport protein B [Rubrivivax gelatinosus]